MSTRLDSRHLLADADGIRLAPTAFASGAKLCDFCTRLTLPCGLDREQTQQRCGQFAPALSFTGRALAGLEGEFSTFRSSSIWYERARAIFQAHRQVGIFNGDTGDLIGFATMTGAWRGPFHALMKRHARSNHLVKAAGIDAKDAPEWLATTIRNIAGKRYVKSPEQIGTVIYVRLGPKET